MTMSCAANAQPPASRPAADVDGWRIEAADREPQNWISTGRNYAETRFSPLQQINAGNVSRLGLAWYFETDSTMGTEATPLVVDGVMYTTTVWNQLHALDARTGKELWRYDPHVNRVWMRYMLSLIHISEPTRQAEISYAVFCLKKKNK